MRTLGGFNKMVKCKRCFKVKLLLFTILMTKQTYAIVNLDQCQNGTIPKANHLPNSKEWVPRLAEASNWRAFMSKLPSIEEANWRDAMNQAIVGTVMETRFLSQDGSINEPFLYEEDHRFDTYTSEELLGFGSSQYIMFVNESVLDEFKMENTTIHSKLRPNAKQEKLIDVKPCKESMQDILLPKERREPCLVTVPSHYVRHYKWPLSQFKARVQNVACSPLLMSRKSQAWMHVNMSTIIFLAGGPMYPKGAESYLNHLMQLVPELKIGTTTRVALDLECGTGSLSHALGMRQVTTLCLTAYDSQENGAQLVMERGFPGLLMHTLDSRSSMEHLPFPSQAFDLLHCAACNISWTSHDGTFMFEANRILHYGGFFIRFGDASNQDMLMIHAQKLCWKLVLHNQQLVVWQKPTFMSPTICSNRTHVTLCSIALEFESKWKVGMKPCLDRTDGFLVDGNWTSRLKRPSKRLKTITTSSSERAKQEVFASDFNYWVYMTDFYIRSLGVSRVADIRNVLDVNAGFGSFAAALAVRTPPIPWWVLNVVPVDEPDRLSLIFDRGLLGIYHDWCEPLDSYALTFDLVHASRFFATRHRCSSQVILLEIDRLLRPGGFILFRDRKEVLLPIQKFAKILHWKAHIDDTESGKWGTEKLLHCQKTR